jgi:hypothetical protein
MLLLLPMPPKGLGLGSASGMVVNAGTRALRISAARRCKRGTQHDKAMCELRLRYTGAFSQKPQMQPADS